MNSPNLTLFRSSLRLPWYDYSKNGGYFITLCTHERKNLFGGIHNGKMTPNKFGKLVEETWLKLPVRFPMIQLDAFVVMPNHFHGILVISKDPTPVGPIHELALQNRDPEFNEEVPHIVF